MINQMVNIFKIRGLKIKNLSDCFYCGHDLPDAGSTPAASITKPLLKPCYHSIAGLFFWSLKSLGFNIINIKQDAVESL